MRASLRAKVFRMNILPVAAAVILFMIVGVIQVRRFAGIMEQTNLEQNDVILDTMSNSMLDMATENFQKYVISEARLVNGELWTLRHDLEILARQVQTVLEEPTSTMIKVPLPSRDNAGRFALQRLYSDYADLCDPAQEENIRKIGALGGMMKEIVSGGMSLDDCVVALPGGASVIMDDTPENKFYSDGRIKSFNVERRPWYVGAMIHGETFFTPVNRDSYNLVGQVMVGVPVYVDDRLAAVCGGSVRLRDLGNIVSDAHLGEYTDSCLINENGNILYSSRNSGTFGMSDNALNNLKESSNPELAALINKALKGDTGFSLITVGDEELYVAYAPVETVGWSQLLMISQDDLNRTAYLLTRQTDDIMHESLDSVKSGEQRTILRTLLIGLVLLVLANMTSVIFANGLVRPIRRMTDVVSAMKGDDMTFQVDKVMLTGDEIELLAKAFESMSVKMKGYVGEIVQITSEKQRLQTELSVAAEIQSNMLPTRFPAFPDRNEFDLYAVMDPAREVGGDFYDFFLIDQDHLAVVIADVSGKGVPAALFMVISKTLIKNTALSGNFSGPAEILADVNNQLCEGNEDNMFVTAWLGILTISTGELVSACAGHEYPVFYRKDCGFTLEKDPHGLAMGGIENVGYREAHWKLSPGDMIFLYTDGVPEANNSNEELFGNERMMDALRKSREDILKTYYDTANAVPGMNADAQAGMTDRMKQTQVLHTFLKLVRGHIDSFAGSTPQFDDLTMLCLEYRGEQNAESGDVN